MQVSYKSGDPVQVQHSGKWFDAIYVGLTPSGVERCHVVWRQDLYDVERVIDSGIRPLPAPEPEPLDFDAAIRDGEPERFIRRDGNDCWQVATKIERDGDKYNVYGPSSWVGFGHNCVDALGRTTVGSGEEVYVKPNPAYRKPCLDSFGGGATFKEMSK